MPRIANIEARPFVEKRKPFRGSNCFAELSGDRYVVYSWGKHWPLHIYANGVWFSNKDRYTQSTNRHHSLTSPWATTEPFHLISKQDMFHVLDQTARGRELVVRAKMGAEVV